MLPVASIYLDEKEKHILDEGGFDEMPYMVSRWAKATGEIFGRSPACLRFQILNAARDDENHHQGSAEDC
jgi:hypothetical protein